MHDESDDKILDKFMKAVWNAETAISSPYKTRYRKPTEGGITVLDEEEA